MRNKVNEQVDSSPGNVIHTTVSWSGNAHSFLSEKVKVKERIVTLYNVCIQMNADATGIIPMHADEITIYLPMGKDCCVYINGKESLFPKEIE